MQQGKTSTNYFPSREEAGYILARRLKKYRYENTIVLALSEGGVQVGASIARTLHSLIAMLMTRDLTLPGDSTVVGVINELGGLTYNSALSTGQLEDFLSEYHGFVEQEKLDVMRQMHVALGQGGLISSDYFRERVVIVVADGTLNGMAFEAAYNFLKAIHTKRVIMVSPVASLNAVDRMHILADEMHCLNVTEGVFEINHYYENNTPPTRAQIISTINRIIIEWHGETHAAPSRHKAVTRQLLPKQQEVAPED